MLRIAAWPVDLGIAVGWSEFEGRTEGGEERGRSEGQPVLIEWFADKGANTDGDARISVETDKGTQSNSNGEDAKGVTGGVLSAYSVRPLEIGLATSALCWPHY